MNGGMMHQLSLIGSYSTELGELYRKVDGCKLCSYHLISEGRVNGSGNPDARLMIVGQGPGPKEIESGKPFTGGSGKLLRKILKVVEIPMNDVYLTNVVRCAPPPGNILDC